MLSIVKNIADDDRSKWWMWASAPLLVTADTGALLLVTYINKTDKSFNAFNLSTGFSPSGISCENYHLFPGSVTIYNKSE